MQFDWKPEYDALARHFLELHFGGSQGLSRVFPCMRTEYRWGSHRPPVPDARIPAKNNTEYHGLERHAAQYHATAQYEFAYHHWLMAAYWRQTDAECDLTDANHENAIRYCVKQALYNQALHEWQRASVVPAPQPELFELTRRDIEKKDERARGELEAFRSKCQQKA